MDIAPCTQAEAKALKMLDKTHSVLYYVFRALVVVIEGSAELGGVSALLNSAGRCLTTSPGADGVPALFCH
jgi:hypothetical protein